MFTRRRLIGAVLAAPAIIKARSVSAIGLMGADPGGSSPTLAFNPTQLITGAGGFWRADQGVTQSGTVSQWNDQTSFGNNLTTQVNAGGQTQPTYSATGFNTSFPGITTAVSGSKGLGITTPYGSTTTGTIFVLLSWGSSNVNNAGMVWDQVSGSDFTNGFGMAASGATSVFVFAAGNTSGAGFTGLTAGNNYIFGVVCDGTHMQSWLNGSTNGAAGSFSGSFGSNTSNIFGFGNNNSRVASAMTVAYWGLTQKAMNSTDWSNLKTWTNSNWGTSF